METNIQVLSPILREAKKQGKKATMNQDILLIDDKKFTIETLHNLPKNLTLESIATREGENEIYFWGRHAPLSNFYTKGSSFMEMTSDTIL